VLSVACGLLFGVVPALTASRVDLAGEVKAGSVRHAGPGTTRLRGAFIAAEVALAVVLSVGAGLLVRTLRELARVEPGFAAAQTLAVRVAPNPSACAEAAGCVALYDDLLRRALAAPGVHAAAAASASPLAAAQPLLPVEVEGQPPVPPGAPVPLLWAGGVTAAYFDVMRIPVLRGRGFTDADGASSAPVIVVSAATARRFWPGRDPIGRTLRVMWEPRGRTVVGVVGDVRQYALSGREPEAITGAFYMPYPQAVELDRRIPRAMTLFVRVGGDAAAASAALREALSVRGAALSVGDVRPLASLLSSSVEEPRALTALFGAFAACALLLAAIGTYGLVSYSAAQRSYEIGLAAALALARGLERFLSGVSASDPATFAGVAALLLLTGLAAGLLPGRRAAAVDPARALRAD
jgi:putative ABC transport system permease protein